MIFDDLTPVKKFLLTLLICACLQAPAQSVFGYWYGYANVQTNSSANNYLVELILQPEKGYVRGVLNYYFKNSFRSLAVKGNYDASTRILNLYDIPVTYHGSTGTFNVDCIMNFRATLRVAMTGSSLAGSFKGQPDYKYICSDISFNLKKNAEISQQDSVLKALREFKETNQVWTPSWNDTLVQANIIQRKVTNYVIEKAFTVREQVTVQEIEVESDSLEIDFYDNGEVDGDSVSVFFNNTLIAFHQKLSTKAVHIPILLDSLKKVNELSMFAENLGSIPPNTALALIWDGKHRYELRISSTLDKTATIRIKRKRDGVKVK